EPDDVRHAVAIHVRQHARVLAIAGPTAGLSPELHQFEDRRRELAAADGERDHNTAAAEPDDIGHAVAIHIGEYPWEPVLASPAAGNGAEFGKLEIRRRKLAAAGRQRDNDAGAA